MRTLLLLALSIASPAMAEEPADAPTEVSFEAVQAASGSEKGNLLVKLIDTNQDDDQAQGKAYRLLAQHLTNEGLEFAAMHAWAKALTLDPDAAAEFVPAMLDLVESTRDDKELGNALGKHAGIDVDQDTRNRMAFLAGRSQLRQGNYGAATGLFMMADKEAKNYEDVALLQGVTLALQGRNADAVAPLATAWSMSEDREPRFGEAALINVARAHYASENFGQAIYHYMQIPRSSAWWPDAQFERAWAHFRSDDMNGALGLLLNHKSPFLDDWFYPEADLLRAYSLFMMCKFGEATKEMDYFVEKYTPLKKDIADALSGLDEQGAYEQVQAFRAGANHKIPVFLLRSFRTDDRLDDAKVAVAAANAQVKQAQTFEGAYGKRVIQWTRARAQGRVEEEGKRVLDRVKAADAELETLTQNIEITRIDLLGFEQQMYERAAATGTLDAPVERGRLRKMNKARKGMRVWPFQGEYWADELGWYQVDARPDCPASMTSGK